MKKNWGRREDAFSDLSDKPHWHWIPTIAGRDESKKVSKSIYFNHYIQQFFVFFPGRKDVSRYNTIQYNTIQYNTIQYTLFNEGEHINLLQFSNIFLSKNKFKQTRKKQNSFEHSMSVGIPQGSILGPLFFLVFINDLPLYLSSTFDTNLTMFADDTIILASGSTVQEVELRLHLLASDVSSWANLNRMALNASKLNLCWLLLPKS